MTGLDGWPAQDELRRLVREVLREVLPSFPTRPAQAPGQPAPRLPNPLSVQLGGSGPVENGVRRVAGPGVAGAGVAVAATGTAGVAGGAVRGVRLETDEDLQAFVSELLRLAGDPRRRADLLAGRLRFTLAVPPPAGQGHAGPGHGPGPGPGLGPGPGAGPASGTWLAGPDPSAAVRMIDRGAVTERAVIAAARAGERLVLGPRAVLTPLARDKARALGVLVEKER
jgi:hypothetical protein